MELDALAQLDGVGEHVVGDFRQLGGEQRLDRRVLRAVAVEALMDVAGNDGGFAVVEVRRVESARVGGEAVGDALGNARAGSGRVALLLAGTGVARAAGHANDGGARNSGAEQAHELAPADLQLAFFHWISPFPFRPDRSPTGRRTASCTVLSHEFLRTARNSYRYTLAQQSTRACHEWGFFGLFIRFLPSTAGKRQVKNG